MKILSIQDAWSMVQGDKSSATPPASVRDAARRGLLAAQSTGRATIGTMRLARSIISGAVNTAALDRLVDYHTALEKGGHRDQVAYLLHGGDAGRRWVDEELEKAERKPSRSQAEEEEPEPPAAHVELRRRIGLLLAAHGEDGAPLSALKDHVAKHGHKAVARAIRDLGHDHRDGKIVRADDGPAPSKKAPTRGTAAREPKARLAPRSKKPAHHMVKSMVLTADAAWRPLRFRGMR